MSQHSVADQHGPSKRSIAIQCVAGAGAFGLALAVVIWGGTDPSWTDLTGFAGWIVVSAWFLAGAATGLDRRSRARARRAAYVMQLDRLNAQRAAQRAGRVPEAVDGRALALGIQTETTRHRLSRSESPIGRPDDTQVVLAVPVAQRAPERPVDATGEELLRIGSERYFELLAEARADAAVSATVPMARTLSDEDTQPIDRAPFRRPEMAEPVTIPAFSSESDRQAWAVQNGIPLEFLPGTAPYVAAPLGAGEGEPDQRGVLSVQHAAPEAFGERLS